jgi:nicotinamidase-related amidase
MTFHVLTAEFIHESNTFKKGETGLHAFQVDTLHEGDAAIARHGDVNAELAGFLDVAREKGWNVTHTISAHASPGARVSREAYDHIAGKICAAAEAPQGYSRRHSPWSTWGHGPGFLRRWRRRVAEAASGHRRAGHADCGDP